MVDDMGHDDDRRGDGYYLAIRYIHLETVLAKILQRLRFTLRFRNALNLALIFLYFDGTQVHVRNPNSCGAAALDSSYG